MVDRTISIGCGQYDRTVALQDGTVTVEGVDLTFERVQSDVLFRIQAREARYDVSEFSLSSYCMLRSQGDSRFIALPIFTSRKFRHSGIYVRADAGIEKPSDLIGKRIGAHEYQQTAAVWIRGILQHAYGVHPSSMEWYFGNRDEKGPYRERVDFDVPREISHHYIDNETTLNEMLLAGELDAHIGAAGPRSFHDGSGKVKRLFPEYRAVEEAYFQETRIFPIMHLVVMKRDVYESDPTLAVKLMDAFSKSKRVGQERVHNTATLFCALPWLEGELAAQEKVLGGDPFPYGVDANRHTLETFLSYCAEQGLCSDERPETLFAPEALSWTEPQ